MSQNEPPTDPNEWSHEQWIEWLNSQDEDDDSESSSVKGPMNRLVKSSGGQVVGSAMLALWNVYYGAPKNDEIVRVTETPDDSDDSIGKLVFGDSGDDDLKFFLRPSALTKGFRVTKLGISKATEVAELYYRTFINTYQGLVDAEILKQVSLEASAEKWQELIEDQNLPKYGPLGLYYFEQLAGMLYVGKSQDHDLSDDTGEITRFYVGNDFQGKGGGGLLLVHALGQIKSAGYKRATLWVLEENLKARGFYERYGFEPDGGKRDLKWRDLVTKDVRYSFRFE